ncbi:putative membrane protein [Vibrio maritimus]|uniref:Putative membrane protein n=1 Tax=Vibrio maritimus TaxID=990268 RepID=A0A090T9H0_9VIBR|nr:putative membrane protein [Vibrio maritimus]
MSDSSTNEAKSDVTSGLSDATQNRILRFTIGVALATFLAAWIDWPLAFVAPIFTAKFLFEKRVLHIDIVYELLLAMIVTVAIGVALSVGFAQYPIPMLLSVAALMLVGYYLFLNPRWNLFATILLMSTLMLPFMAIQSTGTTIFLAVG